MAGCGGVCAADDESRGRFGGGAGCDQAAAAACKSLLFLDILLKSSDISARGGFIALRPTDQVGDVVYSRFSFFVQHLD